MKRHTYTKQTLVLATSLAAFVLAGCNAQAQVTDADTSQSSIRESISVTGFGEAVGVPDMATVDLGVEVRAPEVAEAIEQSNQIVERVTQALIDAGITATDIQSTNFNVWRQEEFDRLTGQPTGEDTYHVDSTVRVKVRDIDQISRMIQVGLDAGANNVFGLTFGIDDTTELEAEARVKALDDAKDRAQQLADSLGMALGSPVVVSELVAGSPLGFISEAALLRGIGGGGGGPPLSPGELTVGIQVDVMYEVQQ